MKGWNSALLLAAMVAQIVADRLPPSVFATVLRYSGLGYVQLYLVLTVLAGYRRRRPYWTRESWQQYLRACALPFGAVVLGLGLVAAQDYHLLVVGASKSTLRLVWAAALLVLMFGGVWRLTNALGWLTDGDPSQQFTRFPKRQNGAETSTFAG